MTQHVRRHKTLVHDELHPIVYHIIVGLTIWLVLSIWMFFDRGSYVSLTLTMITVFFVIVVGIPVLIWLTWRRNTPRKDRAHSLHIWLGEEFRTWTGSITGMEAVVQILLPLVAVSIGMTIFGLVFYLDVPQVGF